VTLAALLVLAGCAVPGGGGSQGPSAGGLSGSPTASPTGTTQPATTQPTTQPTALSPTTVPATTDPALDAYSGPRPMPASDGRPRYVLAVSPASNTVTVGPRELLAVRSLEAIRPRWTETARPGSWRGLAQWRAHSDPVPATVTSRGEAVVVELDEAAHGIAPGQAVVYYEGERVVGSATISATAA